jgi:lipopolysaccharide transport system permease protein
MAILCANLLTKVYFPRLIVPTSSVIVSLLDFFISFGVLAGMMVYFQFVPSINILYLPLFLLMSMVTALGAGLWLASLNVKYRDFRYIVPFIVQFGLYISPVGFSSSVIPPDLRFIYAINPMVGIIDGFRWAILGESTQFYWPGFFLSITLSLLLISSGIIYFRKMERSFADVI